MSLLEQDITKKEQVKKLPELDTGDNNKEYKMEVIWNNTFYVKKSESC